MKTQFDYERKHDSNRRKTVINLEQHFKNNGLSQTGFDKLKQDVYNGDMRADVLVECTERELNEMANDYQLTILQKKSFIKAVKLLPNSRANVNNISNHNNIDNNTSNSRNIRHIYITPQEQNVFTKLKELINTLNQHLSQCVNIQNKNKQTILNGIAQLKHYGDKIKKAIDETINTSVQTVNFD